MRAGVTGVLSSHLDLGSAVGMPVLGLREEITRIEKQKAALGLPVDEVRVPLCHEPGVEAEVDWGRASAVIAGVLTEVFLFLMRSCFSGAGFVQAFPRENQQAFLEGHVAA